MKSLPVGTQSFVELRRNNRYYVDKTAFIKRVLVDDSADVLLITRPRRFGKTLFMDTLKNFLQIDVNRPGEVTERRDLFEGLEILKDAEFCKTYMCQCPTIFLSLKSAEGPTFQRAYQAFARNLTQVAMAFSFLENSPNLSHEDKEFFKLYKNLNYMRDLAHQDDVQSFLQRMIAFLSQHFGRQVVVLIDEYDVPLAKAAASGYYDKMLPLIRGFLGEALKADPQTGSEARPYLKKAILTGCLRVSKESIFTGLNNLTLTRFGLRICGLPRPSDLRNRKLTPCSNTTDLPSKGPELESGMTATESAEKKSIVLGMSSTFAQKPSIVPIHARLSRETTGPIRVATMPYASF